MLGSPFYDSPPLLFGVIDIFMGAYDLELKTPWLLLLKRFVSFGPKVKLDGIIASNFSNSFIKFSTSSFAN